ncbi:MAG: SOS response-associated peptidase [Leeuwenhoekiella sp.]
MCYKTALQKQPDDLVKLTRRQLAVPEEYTLYYHNDAFTQPTLYITPMNDPGQIWPARWGLIPNYILKNDSTGPADFVRKYKTFNARGEEVFDKRSYKESAKSARCLVWVDGFYEPHHYKKKSQPFFCYLEERKLFAFAGLYTALGEGVYTTSFLTVDANETFTKIHNQKKRMPLALDSQFYEDWLSDLNPKQVTEIVNTGFLQEEFKYYPVSNVIYKERGLNSEDAIKPVEAFDPEFRNDTLF